MSGLISDLPRKNGWSIAEHAGDATPDRTQRLLNHAAWDHEHAQGVVRRYVTEHLGDQPLRVAALDESGQEKSGAATAGVQRQYMGCAGRVANGVNTVYCSYATDSGHALVGAALYLPAGQCDDPERRAAMGVPDEVVFRTKPQLAQDILTEMIADKTMPPWTAGDEVYGRSGKLRKFLEDNRIGYVMRVGCAFYVELSHEPKTTMRADAALARFVADTAWQTCSVTGSKGERRYAWAWIATADPRRHLLIRRSLIPNAKGIREVAFYLCFAPEDRPATLRTLIRVAGRRWPV
jgi:SRSO17 transposase